MAGKKLTDRQRKRIIADYTECGNYSEVARKHKINPSTVKRTVDASPGAQEKAEQKKAQNTLDMLEYMDGKKKDAQLFVDACMAEMLKPGRLEAARLSEITTAMGTVIDKFSFVSPGGTFTQGREATRQLTVEELKRLASQIT